MSKIILKRLCRYTEGLKLSQNIRKNGELLIAPLTKYSGLSEEATKPKRSLTRLVYSWAFMYEGRGQSHKPLLNVEECKRDYRSAFELDPECRDAPEGLVRKAKAQKKGKDGRELVSRLLGDAEMEEWAVQHITEFCIVAAAAGHGKKVLKLVSGCKGLTSLNL